MLVGRDPELQELDRACRSAGSSAGQLVVVVAAPGLGRSALAAAAHAAAAASGLHAASVRAAPEAREVPYTTLDAVLSALGRATPAGADRRPSRAREAALTQELVAAFAGASGHRGTCVVLDDAHWADAPSLRVLAHAARQLAGMPALLVLTATPGSAGAEERDALDALLAHERAILLPLAALRPAEAVELLAADGRLGTDPELLAACAAHAGGRPAHLAELLRDVQASTRAPADVPAWVPPHAMASVGSCLGRLGPGATALARALAILGDGALLRRVVALAGLDRRTGEDVADALIAAGLCEAAPGLGFSAPLVRAAVLGGFEPFRLQRWHRRAAALLHEEGEPSAVLVHHILASAPAGEDWVVDPLARAAEEAAAAGECRAAARLLRRALDEPAPHERVPELLADLAFAESRAGLPGAPAHIDAALAATDAPLQRLRLLRERARLMWLTGHLPEAVACSEDAVAVAEEHACPEVLEEALAELLAVASMHDIGMFGDRPALGELLERATSGWVPEAPALAAALAAVLPLVMADVHLLPPLIDRAVEGDLWRLDAAPYGLRVDFALGAMGFADQLERSRGVIEEAVALAELDDDPVRIGRWSYWLAEANYGLGHLDAAVAAGDRAVDRRSGAFISWLGYSAATLTHAHLDRGDVAAARAAAALADERVAPDQLAGMAAAIARGRLLAVTGEADAALGLVLAVAGRITALGHRDSALVAWRPTAIEIATAAGAHEVAAALVAEEIAAAERIRSGARLGRALHLGASLAAPEERLDLLERAVTCLAGTGRRLVLASALTDLGAEQHRLGANAVARASLATAREFAQACGAEPLSTRALTALLATGARPRRVAQTGPASLTPKERRIVELVEQGMTNREVAEELVVAVRTVEWHLGRAYAKLGVRSRVDLAAALA